MIFGTPSTIKLSFDIALTASCRALAAKDKIDLIPHGSGLLIPPESFPLLYDYFVHFMSTVVFSRQTIEIFCNFVIDSVVGKGTAYVQLYKKKGPKRYNATELQKDNVSLSMKLLVILPKILAAPSIEEGDPSLWSKIKTMNALRNRIIHMKPLDKRQGAVVDKDSVFTEILNEKPMNYPFDSLKVMEYYKAGIRHPL